MYLPLAAIVTLAVVGALFAWRRLTGVADRSARRTQDAAPLWRAWPMAATVTMLVVAALLGTMTTVRASEYRSALTLAETVLKRWPNANAQYLVGSELASAGRHSEAIPHLREAVRGYPPARFSLGSELVATGKLDDAIAELQAFVIDEPHLVATRSARILMGRAFEAKREWPHAIEQFRLILATDPDDAQAHGLLADALAGELAFTEAIPHYREFLDVHATDANAWTALGIALVASGKPADAIAAFRNAVNAAPENGHFRQNLARSLLERGDIGGAEEQAEQAAVLDPRDPGAYELLGRVLADQGRSDEARRQFGRSLELDPGYEPAIQSLRVIGRSSSNPPSCPYDAVPAAGVSPLVAGTTALRRLTRHCWRPGSLGRSTVLRHMIADAIHTMSSGIRLACPTRPILSPRLNAAFAAPRRQSGSRMDCGFCEKRPARKSGHINCPIGWSY